MTKQKILIVEDEATLQKALQDVLTQENYEIISALDGEVGYNLAVEKNPDLILLDLILPKKDGFTVLKELKTNQKTANIPVIILTNLEGADDIQKALDLGATTYLVKANYELDDILDKIKEILK